MCPLRRTQCGAIATVDETRSPAWPSISTRCSNRMLRTLSIECCETSCASRPNAGRTECTRGPSGRDAHGLTIKTRHSAMTTPHKPPDFPPRPRGGRNRLGVELPAVAPEAASARPVPAHATANPPGLVWPSSQETGLHYQLWPSSSQALGRHIQFLVSS